MRKALLPPPIGANLSCNTIFVIELCVVRVSCIFLVCYTFITQLLHGEGCHDIFCHSLLLSFCQVRCSKYLYTLSVHDSEKADKLRQSLPPGLQVKDI